MTTLQNNTDSPSNAEAATAAGNKLSLAQVIEKLTRGQLPLRFTAYDGSTTGPTDAELGLNLKSARGTNYLVTAPGELGLVRAYISGDLEGVGVHPGDPYALLHSLAENLKFHRPPLSVHGAGPIEQMLARVNHRDMLSNLK